MHFYHIQDDGISFSIDNSMDLEKLSLNKHLKLTKWKMLF